MNWIKSNPFLAGLAAATFSICAILFFLSTNWRSAYEENKLSFDHAYQSVSAAERMSLFPTRENKDGKIQSLGEFETNLEVLKKLYSRYIFQSNESITPQDFTDNLKLAHTTILKQYEASKIKLPADFFLGFESYQNKLAQSGATRVLSFQLKGIDHLLKALGEAKLSEVIKIMREPAIEETGNTFIMSPDTAVRFHPVEITFRGSESSVRSFLSAVADKNTYHCLVRCLKIENTNQNAPNLKDAKFETVPDIEATVDDSSGFDGFDFDDAEEDAGDQAAEENSEEVATPAEDTSRILYQVLGEEELNVFLRLDLVEVLTPADTKNLK